MPELKGFLMAGITTAVILVLVLPGCASMTETQRGAAGGAARRGRSGAGRSWKHPRPSAPRGARPALVARHHRAGTHARHKLWGKVEWSEVGGVSVSFQL